MPSSPSSSSSATSSPTANTASTPALPRISLKPSSLIEFTLADLWAYVSEHEALQRAEIVSIERYAIVGATNSTSTSALSPTFHPHPRHGFQRSTSFAGESSMCRFLVLELKRCNRKPVWLRITRRRTKKDSRARAGGRQSPVGAFLSNILHGLGFDSRNTEWEIQDRAIMTAKKPLLTHTGFLEEQHTFPPASRPTLKALSQLSTAITQELENYRTWPETNWLFCSLIEEHLHSSGSASLPPPPTVSVSTSTQRKKCTSTAGSNARPGSWFAELQDDRAKQIRARVAQFQSTNTTTSATATGTVTTTNMGALRDIKSKTPEDRLPTYDEAMNKSRGLRMLSGECSSDSESDSHEDSDAEA